MTDSPITPGGVATPPFAFLPQPVQDFRLRATRLRELAADSRLGPYLTFLADLSDAQAAVCEGLADPAGPAPDVARARAAGMPPIDRAALGSDAATEGVLTALVTALEGAEMPAPARLALQALANAAPQDRREVLANVFAGTIPDDAVAVHLFAAAAAQIVLARAAARLRPAELSAIATGVCPACGGRPAVSMVSASLKTLEGTRYACCAGCGTRWNEVRVKCLCCGSMKGISYRALSDDSAAARSPSPKDEPAIKAECCNDCGQWVKIMYQIRLPHLEPLADDAGSLGLDLRMAGGRWRRGGANPWLAGYQ